MNEALRQCKMLIIVLVAAVALAVPLALMVAGGWDMWRQHRAQQRLQAEHAAALQASLERAADVVLPVPTLTGEPVELAVPLEKLEEELQRVVRIARGVGGSVASWNDGATIRLVANVPSSVEEVFREALQRGIYDVKAEGETARMTVIQVLLRPED